MKRIHPVVWGLMCSLVVATITWFTCVGAMHDLPLSLGQEILFYIHYPEVLADTRIFHIFPPHSQSAFWIITGSVHCLYWFSLGSLSGFVYAWIKGDDSKRRHA